MKHEDDSRGPPIRSKDEERKRLRALHAYGVLDSGPEIEFDDIAELAAEICGTPIAVVSLVDADRLWFMASFGLDLRETPMEQSFCAHAVATGSRLIVPSASEDVRFAANPLVTGAPGIRFYAGEPLIAPGGEVLGTLCVIDRVERELTEKQLRALNLLAREVMTHLELRRSLAELRVVEERYRTMFDANPQPMWAYDQETLAFLAVNDAAMESYGYSLEEFKDIRPEEDIGSLLESTRNGTEGLERAGIWRHRTKQGREILVEITSHTINYGGRPARIVNACDVTEKRETESQLRLLELCVSKLNDFILITEADPISDPGPRIIFANDTFIEKTGFTREEVLGKSPRILQGPRTERAALDRIRAALARQEPVREELINYTKDGKEMHLDIDIVPIFDPDGKCSHFAAIQRDITEKKDLERQVLRAQRMESIGTLAGGIAHDLNNILAPIVLAIDLLREHVEQPEGVEILDLVANSAERGADMVNQVLAFARGVDSEVRTVFLDNVTNDLERIVKDTFPKNIRFEIRSGPDLWATRGDATRIYQVLLNLCVNSRDAMPDGGEICAICENIVIDEDFIDISIF